MIVYRVCSANEARAQIIGEPYRIASNTTQVMHSTLPGFHVTLYPEHWRRILNRQMADRGQGQRYTHTLLLDTPDGTMPTEQGGPLPGEEFRLRDASQVIVRAVAGPQWPVPAWCPQPTREIDWEPTSTQWKSRVCRWQPRKEQIA